ncbi:hypothetical protein V8G54_029501 [Vigna mungo]|uniref:Uncharacterized protein n=1 Tax=Vigna mungo TaxID=3915 RepID=A0AAQ3MUS0_VIGMU
MIDWDDDDVNDEVYVARQVEEGKGDGDGDGEVGREMEDGEGEVQPEVGTQMEEVQGHGDGEQVGREMEEGEGEGHAEVGTQMEGQRQNHGELDVEVDSEVGKQIENGDDDSRKKKKHEEKKSLGTAKRQNPTLGGKMRGDASAVLRLEAHRRVVAQLWGQLSFSPF